MRRRRDPWRAPSPTRRTSSSATCSTSTPPRRAATSRATRRSPSSSTRASATPSRGRRAEATTPTTKTFFGKFVSATTVPSASARPPRPRLHDFINTYAAAFQFPGDGREPLGDRYGFRYLADQANNLQSWAIVWRSDYYQGTQVNLCTWAAVAAHGRDQVRFGYGRRPAPGPGPHVRQRREPVRRRRRSARPVRSASRLAVPELHLPRVPAHQPADGDGLEPGQLQGRLGRPHAPRTRPHGRDAARPASTTWVGSVCSTRLPARSSASATRLPT